MTAKFTHYKNRPEPIMIIGYMLLGVLIFMMGAIFGLELAGCASAIQIPI